LSPNLLVYTRSFSPTAALATVQGSVVTENGRGIRNIIVSITNGSTSEVKVARTNPFGYFRFDELEVGSFYIVTIINRRYHFDNNNLAFTLNDDLNGLTFVGTPTGF
jgi:hypothetical protein